MLLCKAVLHSITKLLHLLPVLLLELPRPRGHFNIVALLLLVLLLELLLIRVLLLELVGVRRPLLRLLLLLQRLGRDMGKQLRPGLAPWYTEGVCLRPANVISPALSLLVW